MGYCDHNKELFGYERCMVEDFMLIKPQTEVLVLIPKKDVAFKSFKADFMITFQSKKYHVTMVISTLHPTALRQLLVWT